MCPTPSSLVRGEALRRESGVTAQGAGLAAFSYARWLYGHMGFHKAVKLELLPYRTYCFGRVVRHVYTASIRRCTARWQRVRAIGMSKILAAGSDAAVIPGSSAWLQAFSSKCDVLTTWRSARSASLALAGFVRVSVPDAMGPLPAVTQAGSLLVARTGSHVSLRWPSARETAFFQRMTTR